MGLIGQESSPGTYIACITETLAYSGDDDKAVKASRHDRNLAT